MAIYHCSISNVSRAAGSRSTATLSYISGEKIQDTELEKTYNYGREERVIECETIFPNQNCSEKFENHAELFNSIEKYEQAKNARTAKKIEVALPAECTLDEQRAILKNFIKLNITDDNYACTYAIHVDTKNKNPHAHILIANRQLDKAGEWSAKRKMQYVLDENGNRIPQLDEQGNQKTDKNGRKQWKRISAYTNPLDTKAKLRDMRKSWADCCNEFLPPELHISHESHKKRNLITQPTIHEGYAAREIEKRGGIAERCEINRQIKQSNAEILRIQSEIEARKLYMKGLKIDEQSREYNKYSFKRDFAKNELFTEDITQLLPTFSRSGGQADFAAVPDSTLRHMYKQLDVVKGVLAMKIKLRPLVKHCGTIQRKIAATLAERKATKTNICSPVKGSKLPAMSRYPKAPEALKTLVDIAGQCSDSFPNLRATIIRDKAAQEYLQSAISREEREFEM